MVTPLPNITVYYTGYRIYSHFRALQGCAALESSLALINSRQLRDLREQVCVCAVGRASGWVGGCIGAMLSFSSAP